MKPDNWRTDYDWTDPDDYPVQDDKMFDIQSEEELMLPHEIKAPPKGIESLREGQRFADADPIEKKILELMARGLSRELAEVIVKSGMSEDSYEIMDKAEGGRIGYAYGDEDPEVVEDDLTTLEFMQDQGVPYGEQASGIDKDVLIEKVVEEFIKRKGRKPRSIEEIKTFYMQEMAGGSGEPQRVAYNPGDYDPMIVDEYEKYKGSQEEQGGPVITIDEFLMETRAGVRAGGLPGILGV